MACAKRQPASIVGDGYSTVCELIDKRNNDPRRGKPNQLNSTLHAVEKTDNLIKVLNQQNINFQTKLKKGKKIIISYKINSGNGADIINVTKNVHPDIKNLLERCHKTLNIPISGLDFICAHISSSWKTQSFGIIENNGSPYIDIHHYPSEGEPINVASKIWDFVLDEKNNNFII